MLSNNIEITTNAKFPSDMGVLTHMATPRQVVYVTGCVLRTPPRQIVYVTGCVLCTHLV